jgi:hypothetical protein
VLGGWNGVDFTNDVWYSSDGINWTQATENAEWSAREGHTTVVFDNKVWLLGGLDINGLRDDVWYSTNGVNWTQATSSAGWLPRCAHTSVVFNNMMWVLGGMGQGYIYLNDVWYSRGRGIGEERTTLEAERLMPEIYPNPAKDVIYICFPPTFFLPHQWGEDRRRGIKIFDVSGKLVKVAEKVTSAQSHKQEVRISLKGINPGIYFLKLGKETKKFLVVK